MTENSIVVKNLSYRYGKLLAVDHINFEVGAREILGFLGPNGAGKTTTVKMLTGQLRPQEGQAILMGYNVVKETEKVQSQIGVCFEQTNLYEQMTAIDNLVLFAEFFGVKNFDANALLKRVGLSGREKDKVANYSKGMKQRLMVARSLVNSPQIIFLDEPTAGLDPVSSETIGNIILEEQKRGATIFLTTHDMWEADKLCNRVAFMNEGKIAVLDTPHSLKQKYGKRSLIAEVAMAGNKFEKREIHMDSADTPHAVEELFKREKVVTLHSEEATLEDIFIKVTGRRLAE
jgi:ABC-2 type transport system ATP-binding protein